MSITPFLWTLLGNLVIAIWIIWVVLIVKYIKNRLIRFIDYITAITVGLLLGIVFIWFIPELSESHISGRDIGLFMLVWLFLFYLLELFLHWHHCKDLEHGSDCHSHHHDDHQSGFLMFGWTILHNAFHWIVLFSAFAIDLHFGIATTLAILLHSIPQNIVNYIMNHHRIIYSLVAAFGWLFWALLTYPFADYLVDHKYYILAIIAGWLLYTALADIFPGFKNKWETKKKILYLIFIFIWILSFLGFEEISEDDHGHGEEMYEDHDDYENENY